MQILFIDTETGGLDPARHSLLQIGAVAYDYDSGVLGTLKIDISRDHYEVTPEALMVNGINLDDLRENGVKPAEATKKLVKFIKQLREKPILAGHNVAFDRAFLQQLFAETNTSFDLVSHRLLDTMSMLWGLHFAGKIPLEACSSGGAFRYFDCEPLPRAHDALADCMATVKLFEKLVVLMKSPEVARGQIIPRPEGAPGVTHRLDTGCGKIYLTVNHDPVTGKILETFITTGSDGGCLIYTEATSRLISLALRAGVAVDEIVEQLDSTHSCPAYQLARGRGKDVSLGKSCPSAIAKRLAEIAAGMG